MTGGGEEGLPVSPRPVQYRAGKESPGWER